MASKTTTQPKKPQTEATVVKDAVLDMVTRDFKQSWDYCLGSWHDRWHNNYQLYHNQRTKRGYFGITDTFVPMVFGTVETLTSALFGTKPKFDFIPPHAQKDQNTDILNGLLDYWWDKDQWSIKVIDTGREMLQLGTSLDYFYWHNDHPSMIHVPLRDFFIDPTATSIENARYMGRRYLTTIGELRSFQIIDLDNPTLEHDTETGVSDYSYAMKAKYTNLDDLKQPANADSVPEDQKTDQQEKNDLYGSTLPQSTDQDDKDYDETQVEVLEYWTNDKVISVMNRKVKIEDNENYYKTKARENGEEYPQGIMPFAAARDFVDPSLFYATSEIDVIADEQELLNDLTNQRVDAVTFVLNPMYTLDPDYSDKIEEVENLPGAVYPFEAGKLQRIEMGTVDPNSFNETMNIKNDIREVTGINEVVKGAGDVNKGANPTATEINAQMAGAGQRINLKITQLENEYFHRMARIVFAMTKLYVTEPMMVRIMGKDGAKWQEFDPAQFQGDYEPRVQLDISVQNKKQQQAAQAKELLAAFVNDPEINQQELKKLVLARSFDLEPDEVTSLLQPAPMIDPMTGMPMPSGMGQAMPQLGAGGPTSTGLPSGQTVMAPEDQFAPTMGDSQPAGALGVQ